jgi:hypothetical protein
MGTGLALIVMSLTVGMAVGANIRELTEIASVTASESAAAGDFGGKLRPTGDPELAEVVGEV